MSEESSASTEYAIKQVGDRYYPVVIVGRPEGTTR